MLPSGHVKNTCCSSYFGMAFGHTLVLSCVSCKFSVWACCADLMDGASQHVRTCVRVCSSRHCFTSVCVILWATKQTSNPRVGFMLPVRGSLFARACVDRLLGTVKISLASPCRGRFPNGCFGRNRVCMRFLVGVP